MFDVHVESKKYSYNTSNLIKIVSLLSPTFKIEENKVSLFTQLEVLQRRYRRFVDGNQTPVQWFDYQQQEGFVLAAKPLIGNIKALCFLQL